MNYSIVRNIIGKLMYLMALLMILPLIVCLINIKDEGFNNVLSFVIPILLLIGIGKICNIKKASESKITAKEGFIIVGLSWIIMSLFGCLPFLISKEIPNFFDAFFEITSGFTTTGASVVTNVEELSHSILFWRSFSHWIGGMGVLVFILAIIPESKEGSSMHILRAESPGPQVGKLVSKMKASSRILYLIYMALTIIEVILLWAGPDKQMDLFSSLIYSFGTAGTGGFAIVSTSVEYYSIYSQYVISIFMIVFGINFSLFYLLLLKNYKEVLKNEELRWYLCLIVLSVIIIFCNTLSIYKNVEQTFRLSLFQTASIISTTGYSTANYDTWGSLSKGVLIILMFFGSCAGSTAGGIKISRMIILIKSSGRKIGKMVNPRKVESVNVNGKPVDDDTIDAAQSFFILYLFILALCAIIISIDGFDLITNITASLACISNVGPGLGEVGPYGSFSNFSWFSKLVLSIEMLAGRLELFPVLVLFSPKTWIKNIKYGGLL